MQNLASRSGASLTWREIRNLACAAALCFCYEKFELKRCAAAPGFRGKEINFSTSAAQRSKRFRGEKFKI